MSQTKRLCFWSATELLQAYQDKSLSPVDVCKDVLVRIKEVNDSVCAMNFVEDETIVIRKAKESEERYKNGTQNGLLDGVPVT
jgi:aspartyl-tRNA(Asn)/glutamyl-tRNA(Gln) amidotransferase subunit A